MKMEMIPVLLLEPHPDNPRKNLGDLTELTESIRKNGVMQNLTVFPVEDGLYRILIGHRRAAAALQAGLEKVPCNVIKAPEPKEQQAVMLEENMQRSDLTVTEQAQGFQMMLDLGYTAEEISRKTGFSETTVYHRLNIAKLNKEEVQKKMDAFQLSLSDLYLLEQIEDVKTRDAILKRSQNSSGLAWEVNKAKEDSKKKAMAEKIIARLEGLGIRKKTEEHEKLVKSCELFEYSEDVFASWNQYEGWDKYTPEKGKEVFWAEGYGAVYLLSFKKRDRKEEEAQNREKERAEAERTERTKTGNAVLNEIKQFVRFLVTDKNAPKVEDKGDNGDLFFRLMENRGNLRDIPHHILGINTWADDKRLPEIRGRLKELSVRTSLVAAEAFDAAAETIYWHNGEPCRKGVEKIAGTIRMLKEYGFSMSQEHEKFMSDAIAKCSGKDEDDDETED